jgi:hypothetical protein
MKIVFNNREGLGLSEFLMRPFLNYMECYFLSEAFDAEFTFAAACIA